MSWHYSVDGATHFFNKQGTICKQDVAFSTILAKLSVPRRERCKNCLEKGTHNLLLEICDAPQIIRFNSAAERQAFKDGYELAAKTPGSACYRFRRAP